MKADAVKRAQAKKSANRRRTEAKKGDAASINNESDEKLQREREREARDEKKAKQAADTAMHQHLVNMVIEQSDFMLAKQRSQRAFVATEPDAPKDVLSNALAVRGPNLLLDRTAATRRLVTVPKQDPDPFYQTNPDGYTECIIQDAHTKTLASSLTPTRVPRTPQLRFRIRTSPISGQGMFAIRDLQLNDLIHSERALLITPTKPWVDAPSAPGISKEQSFNIVMRHHEEVLEMSWERMTSEAKDAYMGLANSCSNYGPFMGVKKTNELSMRFEKKGDSYSVTYNKLSRVNHSCLPNAAIHFNTKTFAGELRALRAIKAGDEILVAYIPISDTTSVRQTNLQKAGFICKCRLCTDTELEEIKHKAINERSALIDNYLSASEAAKKKMRKEEHERMLKASSTWVETIEKEGLEGLRVYDRHLEVIGNALMHLGRVVESLDIGEKRAKLGEARSGDEDGVSAKMMKIRKAVVNGATPRMAAMLNGMRKEYGKE